MSPPAPQSHGNLDRSHLEAKIVLALYSLHSHFLRYAATHILHVIPHLFSFRSLRALQTTKIAAAKDNHRHPLPKVTNETYGSNTRLSTMTSKLFQSPRVDTQTLVDGPLSPPAGPACLLATILSTMEALLGSHRVLENLIIRTWNKSQDLPLSTDEKFSIEFLILFTVYVFIVYPFLICPTADIPGPYVTSTPIGFLLYYHRKGRDNGDQWALELHKTYGAVVRLTPTLVSLNDPTLLPRPEVKEAPLSLKSVSSFSNGSANCSFSKTTNGSVNRSSLDSTAEHIRDTNLNLFSVTVSDVMADLRIALRGQKTVDIHELLSRHLRERIPASFPLALAHAIYQLSHPMHRHYLTRLARQLAVGESATQSDEGESVKLLDAVVKESLRMQQAPNHRALAITITAGGAKLGDYELYGDTKIVSSLYCVSRNSAIFDRPDEYNPNRWLESSKATDQMDEALSFVLNHHRAIKPEFDTTIAHLKVLLAELLRRFDMKLPLGEQPSQLDTVTLQIGGCRVRFRERKQAVEKKVRFAEHVIM